MILVHLCGARVAGRARSRPIDIFLGLSCMNGGFGILLGRASTSEDVYISHIPAIATLQIRSLTAQYA